MQSIVQVVASSFDARRLYGCAVVDPGPIHPFRFDGRGQGDDAAAVTLRLMPITANINASTLTLALGPAPIAAFVAVSIAGASNRAAVTRDRESRADRRRAAPT